MAAESEDLEEKSAFAGSDKEWLELVKTVVAMANADGGVVVLRAATCDEGDLILSSFPTAERYERQKYGAFRSRDLILAVMS